MSGDRKTAVLTGATGGIGAEVARAFAARGDRLILAGRDQGKLDAVLAALSGDGHASVRADLSLVSENRRAAAAIMEAAPCVDLLLNVAGAIIGDRHETAEGNEMTLAVNLLGPIALSHALLPALRAAPAPRVVMTGSEAIAFVRDLAPGDIQSTRRYRGFPGAYARAKAWLTVWALSRPLGDVPVLIADPGGTKTDMTTLPALPLPIRLLRPFIMHGPDVAARAFVKAGAELPLAQAEGRIVTPKKIVVPKAKFTDPATIEAVREAVEARLMKGAA